MKMVKCLPEFEYFTVFLKNRNVISKIRRSKVTDYAALRGAMSAVNNFISCNLRLQLFLVSEII